MFRNLKLLSYNKRVIVQETWSSKKYDNESDEEFMAMLLDDPKTQAIIKANKKLKQDFEDMETNDSGYDSSEDSSNNSEADSNSDRLELLPFNKNQPILLYKVYLSIFK